MQERDPQAEQIVEAWNLMGGAVDWNALPIVAELLGVDDPEALVRGVCQIRDHFRDQERDRAETQH